MRNRFLTLLLMGFLVFGTLFIFMNASAYQPAAAEQSSVAQTGAEQQSPAQLRELPANIQAISAEDLTGEEVAFTPRPRDAQVISNYMVQLADAPAAELWLNAQGAGESFSSVQAQAYGNQLLAKQAAVSSSIEALGGKTLANYTKLINGIAVEISADRVRDLYQIPGVVSVSLIPDYELHLDETVPWIGATAVQTAGYDGTGITVAVLDSGIDYTHEHLGGSGLQADTDQAIAEASQPADPALYPTAKVIGGYDFVGSVWPNGALIPDPNPMDDEGGNTDGHGTHVASIIGGVETTELGPGVAPGVEFYALKVCSSVSTSCSGVALLQAYEWAADPEGDSTFRRADVVNMSLGALYGQPNDSDTQAVEMLSQLGSVVVVSAGNSANLPYISGSPSIARSTIGVAQSTVPSEVLFRIRRDAPTEAIMDAVFQPWSAVPTAAISGDVVYGNGNGTNLNGCVPFTEDLTGKVSVIDRGACNFSLKVLNAEAAGAEMAIIALVAPGDPFTGSWGGEGYPTIPGFMVSQANGNLLKVTGATATIDPNDPDLTVDLLDVMVGSSSRGPSFDTSYLKPNISAPGASVSASSGDQSYSVFGGTSGAAPMVSGAAAQLLDQAGGRYSLAPIEVKALLMNNAVTETWQDYPGGMLNPITRQGSGRVDVEAASLADTLAWVPADGDVGLSFGFETVAHPYADTKTIKVVNTAGLAKTYDITATFRYTDDLGAGVEIALSTDSLMVPAGGNGTFDVELTVDDPLLLKDWPFAGGSTMVNGNLLTDIEADGFVTLTANDGEVINLPWHFLPRQSADVTVDAPVATSPTTQDVVLNNSSVVTGTVEAYPLFEISPELSLPSDLSNAAPADLKYVGADAIRVSATDNVLLFAISSWNSRSHPINVEYDVYIDVDQDGIDDYVAYSGLFNDTADPRPVSVLCNLAPVSCTVQYYLDTTLNTTNMVIPVQVPDADMAFDFYVLAFDAYYGGAAWDWSPLDGGYHTFDAQAPAFYPDAYGFDVPAEGSFTSEVTAMPNFDSPSQIGMLYRVTNGVLDGEVFGVDLTQGEYTLDVNIVGSGDVVQDPIQSTYEYGDVVTLGASPNYGWEFSDWSGDLISTDEEVELFIMGNTEVTATFVLTDGVYDLTILHTNDFHARVDEFDVGGAMCAEATPERCIGGSARISTLVNEFRDLPDTNLLVLDAGDQFQGTLYYNLFKSEVLAAMMNAIEYDAMAAGNHEFDDGPDELATFIDSVEFPVLAVNIEVSVYTSYLPVLAGGSSTAALAAPVATADLPGSSLVGKLQPYALFERGGEQIAVIGVITPDTANISSPGENIIFLDPITTVQAQVDLLTDMGVDKIFVLSHQGYSEDLALAEQVDGVDVIIGGHSHTFLYNPVVPQVFTPPNLSLTPAGQYPTVAESLGGDPVLIVSAFEWGKFLGRLDVTFLDGIVVAHDGNPIYVSNAVAKDPEIETILAPYREEVNALMTLKVGEITVDAPLNVEGTLICRKEECLLGNLVTDTMLWQINTVGGGDFQIALQNGGGLRAPLLAGDVTYGGVMNVLPFGNTIATMELKGEYLLAALEHSVRLYPATNGGFLQVSGMRYEFDPAAPVNSRIVSAEVWNGTGYDPVDPDAMYKIVTNNFTRNGGDGYTWFRDYAVNPYDFGPALHEAVIDYFEEFSPVTPVLQDRITTTP